jgi:hypothetical protein
MPGADLSVLSSRLAVSALASLMAIILWSRTRDPAWMLIVVGTIAAYADIVFSLLAVFGVIDPASFSWGGIPVASIVFANLPALFYAIAFLIMIVRKRIR